MALENMKSMFGKVVKTWNNFNVYGQPAQINRNTNKKPVTQIVQGGGYSPGNKYGDDHGIDEV